MDRFDQASFSSELPATAAGGGGAPVWVHLLPLGRVAARDGRSAWSLGDAAAVIAATRANAAELVIDFEHQTDHAERNGMPAPAAGWIKELDSRPDGIWGRVEWTDRARAMIQAREYRFLSPVFQYDPESRAVKRLLRAGLTNNPALGLTALARAKEQDMKEFLAKLAKALGLAETSDEAAVLAAIGTNVARAKALGGQVTAIAKQLELPETAKPEELSTALAKRIEKAASAEATAAKAAGDPDPAKFVNMADYQRLSTALATLQDEVTGERATGAVDAEIAAGKLVPAQREWALGLFKSDREAFDAFIDKQPVIVAPASAKASAGRPAAAGAELDDEDLALCKRMGLDPAKYKATRDAEATL